MMTLEGLMMAAPTTERETPAFTAGQQRTVQLDGTPLVRVGARPGLLQYLRDIWRFRHFLYYDSHSRVSSANSYDSLGRLWMVFNPILFGSAYFFVFGILLETGRGISNFIGYLVIGVFMFRFFTSAVNGGSNAIAGNQKVVQAFNFPRACLVLSSTIRELFSSVPVFLVMAGLVYLLGDTPLEGSPRIEIHLNWHWLLFFPCVALALLVMAGWSLALARAVNAYNDVKHLISFGTRILFYTSAVFFHPDRWANAGQDWITTIMHHNPLFCVLDIIRGAWLYDGDIDPYRWVVLGAWAAGSLIIGFLIFWHGEETYGRER
ncbi:ABC transporter permease [Nesterenkonia lacusekhoensis]|nr:ABC transporter permease [Nesterenkonia lacusekhoensis]